MRSACLIFLFLTLNADSARAAEVRGFYAGGGFHFSNLLKVSGSDRGSRALLGEAYFPELTVGFRTGRWFPLFGFSLLGNALSEGNKHRGVMRLQVPYVFTRAEDSNLEWKAGPGIVMYRVYGPGGTVRLGNGNATTDFHVPEKNSAIRLLYLMGGLAITDGQVRYDFDFIATGFLTNRRAFTLTAGAGYVF